MANDEFNLDSYFEEAESNQDREIAGILASAGLLGALLAITSLNPSGTPKAPKFPTTPKAVTDISSKEFEAIFKIKLDPKSLIDFKLEKLKFVFNNKELESFRQLGEQIKHLGRIEDPRTIEMRAFKNAEQISDMLGMFGDFEAWKSGMLDRYLQYENMLNARIMIPWVTMGDENVCNDCLELEANGSYSPDEYPEPPHFGCRCEPGEPEIVFE